MPVYFVTPGTIELAAFTTMGLHAKPNTPNPIGYFGTGLKFAVATLLRHGAKLTLETSGCKYEAKIIVRQFRGESFNAVVLCQTDTTEVQSPIELNITDQLGKNWKLWMAYRELYSNTVTDEHGIVVNSLEELDSIPEPRTIISVDLPDFDIIHHSRAEFLLDPKKRPDYTGVQLEISADTVPVPNVIFYRGIKVHEFDASTVQTYNLIQPQTLTEDRTLANTYQLLPMLAAEMLRMPEEANQILYNILCAPRSTWEYGLTWYTSPSIILAEPAYANFRKVLESLRDNHYLIPGARKLLANLDMEQKKETTQELDPYDAQTLQEALGICAQFGWKIDYKVEVRETLGVDVLGQADVETSTILLSKEVFEMGKTMLVGTLLEEFWHLKHGFQDETRAFQNFLINTIVRQAARARNLQL